MQQGQIKEVSWEPEIISCMEYGSHTWDLPTVKACFKHPFFIYLFIFNCWCLFYNIVLISVIHQAFFDLDLNFSPTPKLREMTGLFLQSLLTSFAWITLHSWNSSHMWNWSHQGSLSASSSLSPSLPSQETNCGVSHTPYPSLTFLAWCPHHVCIPIPQPQVLKHNCWMTLIVVSTSEKVPPVPGSLSAFCSLSSPHSLLPFSLHPHLFSSLKYPSFY